MGLSNRSHVMHGNEGVKVGLVLAIVGAAIYLIGVAVIPFADGWTLLGMLWAPHWRMMLSLAASFQLLGIPVFVLGTAAVGLRRGGRRPWAFIVFGFTCVWFVPVLRDLLVSRVTSFPVGDVLVLDIGTSLALVGGGVAAWGARNEQADLSVASLDARGFVLALGGALVYVGATFLPYLRYSRVLFQGISGSIPAAQPLVHGLVGDGVWVSASRAVGIYGSALIVGGLAIAARVARRREQWAEALLGAAVAWAILRFPTNLLYRYRGGPTPQAGYWGVVVGVLLALAGAILAVAHRRTRQVAVEPLAAG
jgi:hypothetical protein